MNKEKPLEDRMYTAKEVEEIVKKRSAESRERRDEVILRYAGESSRMFLAMIELDVSFDIIDALYDTPLLREKGFTSEHIKLAKWNHWQKQIEKRQ